MKKRLFFDMDNVLVDFQSGLDKIDEETKNKYRAKGPGEKDRLDEIPGLFGKMEPMPGAIEAVHKLAEVYDVFILSTAPWKNPSAWSDKVMWVTKYFDDVFHKRMIITHRKDLVEGDYLIDDRGKNGTSEFRGEWIQFGSERFPNWDTVVKCLLNENRKAYQNDGKNHVPLLLRERLGENFESEKIVGYQYSIGYTTEDWDFPIENYYCEKEEYWSDDKYRNVEGWNALEELEDLSKWDKELIGRFCPEYRGYFEDFYKADNGQWPSLCWAYIYVYIANGNNLETVKFSEKDREAVVYGEFEVLRSWLEKRFKVVPDTDEG